MIGIIGAIPEEVNAIINEMQLVETRLLGGRKYYVGSIENQDCVVIFSRVGKVAAAITTTTLIHEFQIKNIIFTGVAGGIQKHIKVGDVVLGTYLAQHDFDAFPLFPRNEIPLINKILFKTDDKLNAIAQFEIDSFLNNDTLSKYITLEELEDFGITKPTLHTGLIVSGDQFVYEKNQIAAIHKNFPEALCTEMEGAAVAQVCYEYNIPFIVIRTISDNANETASVDFKSFIDHVSNKYGLWIIRHILQNIKKAG